MCSFKCLEKKKDDLQFLLKTLGREEQSRSEVWERKEIMTGATKQK